MEITERIIQVRAEAGQMPAFVAAPQADGRYAAVIVVMEAFGLNSHIKSVTKRLAREGYVAVAPDLYYREPNAVAAYDNLPEAIRMMTSLWDSKILSDVDAIISFLQKQANVRGDRIGMTGFCMGGRITFLTACNNRSIKAAVPFYGGGTATVVQPSDRTPIAPLDYADKLEAPMLLFFGGQDAFIPLEQVDKIKARLRDLGKDAETIVFPEADHGFFCDERASYDRTAAEEAWRRLTEFFSRHLKS